MFKQCEEFEVYELQEFGLAAICMPISISVIVYEILCGEIGTCFIRAMNTFSVDL